MVKLVSYHKIRYVTELGSVPYNFLCLGELTWANTGIHSKNCTILPSLSTPTHKLYHPCRRVLHTPLLCTECCMSAVSSRDAINATGYNIAINQKRWKLGEEIFINWNKKPKNLGKTEKEAGQRFVNFHDTKTALMKMYLDGWMLTIFKFSTKCILNQYWFKTQRVDNFKIANAQQSKVACK